MRRTHQRSSNSAGFCRRIHQRRAYQPPPVSPMQQITASTGTRGNGEDLAGVCAGDGRSMPARTHWPNLAVQCLNLSYSGNISLTLQTSSSSLRHASGRAAGWRFFYHDQPWRRNPTDRDCPFRQPRSSDAPRARGVPPHPHERLYRRGRCKGQLVIFPSLFKKALRVPDFLHRSSSQRF